MPKSFLDYAFDYMDGQANPVSFTELWNYVKKAAELTDEQAAEKVSRFYTNLILDGRFVTLGENNWDLRVRHTFEKVHIDMKDVYSDDDVSSDAYDPEEDDENEEYNKVFEEEKTIDDNDDEALAPETNVDEEETL